MPSLRLGGERSWGPGRCEKAVEVDVARAMAQTFRARESVRTGEIHSLGIGVAIKWNSLVSLFVSGLEIEVPERWIACEAEGVKCLREKGFFDRRNGRQIFEQSCS